ncbi:tannase/feruloyl esterase family alpha/beta hydrolase [Nocardioides sp. NPDC047086]|uniref:tannase/feruloyl esterase family alpha/beta hydrolase n=1 Tax=Nocardioides sp. NPDC047086 TaxID=3154810 RepID=UPI0033CAEFCE
MSEFRRHGGKLIMWHGEADPAVPPTGTIAYYQAVTKQMGGLARTQEFARLFMLPGVAHRNGGEGCDVSPVARRTVSISSSWSGATRRSTPETSTMGGATSRSAGKWWRSWTGQAVGPLGTSAPATRSPVSPRRSMADRSAV